MNRWFIVGLGWVASLTLLAAFDVGTEVDGRTYTAALPIMIFVFSGLPFAIGIQAGRGIAREDSQQCNR